MIMAIWYKGIHVSFPLREALDLRFLMCHKLNLKHHNEPRLTYQYIKMPTFN